MQSSFNRSVKLVISLAFLAVCYVRNVFRRMAGRRVPGSAVVLYYHGIRPEQRKRFARQMDMLLKYARPVKADFSSSVPDGSSLVAVTFDDGFLSFLETALPELKERKIPSTLFMIAGDLGCYPDWSGYIPDPSFTEPLLTADQLRLLPPESVTIGSHTLTHPTMTELNEDETMRELVESRERLEKTLGRTVTLFSFPHGAFHEKLIECCRESGYERVFTILPYLAFSAPGEYAVGRVRTDPEDWPVEFWLKLMGAYSWLPLAYALKRKIFAERMTPPPPDFERRAA